MKPTAFPFAAKRDKVTDLGQAAGYPVANRPVPSDSGERPERPREGSAAHEAVPGPAVPMRPQGGKHGVSPKESPLGRTEPGRVPAISDVAIYELTGPFTTWAWLCEFHAADYRRRDWTTKKLPGTVLRCDRCVNELDRRR